MARDLPSRTQVRVVAGMTANDDDVRKAFNLTAAELEMYREDINAARALTTVSLNYSRARALGRTAPKPATPPRKTDSERIQ